MIWSIELIEWVKTHIDTMPCRCCGVLKIDPALVRACIDLERDLGTLLQPTNCYRCPKHNAEVGGARTSRHMDGRAIDIMIPNVNRIRFEMAARKYFGGLLRYDDKLIYHMQLDKPRT
jgi:zinc D-Ala-D-Ala carboxypeptidase